MIRNLTFPKYDDNEEKINLYDINEMSKNIVFLDFDGVIIPYKNDSRWKHNLDELTIYLARKYNDEIFLFMNPGDIGASYYDFDPVALGRLRKLLDETESEIVIHSDYRWHSTKEKLKALFKIHGMDDYILDMCDPHEDKDIAIKRYLAKNKDEIESYVIFDDNININRGFEDHFILTKDCLTNENIEEAKKVLNRY